MSNVYTGASGMIAFQTKLDVLGNNIANIKSNGYKADQETFKVFEEGMRSSVSNSKKSSLGTYQNQVHIDNIYTNYNPGLIQVTNRALDVSIKDSNENNNTVSFFEVDAGGQNYLTRDGAFEIDGQNYLTLMNGSYLLNRQGERIQVPENAELSITKDGRILDKNNGNEITQLSIRTINKDDLGFLEKSRGTMFKIMEPDQVRSTFGEPAEVINSFDSNITLQKMFNNTDVFEQIQNNGQINLYVEDGDYEINSQTLEQSNVDLADQMNELIIAQKGYQANSKALTTFDKVNEKDANQIGV